MGFKNKVGRPIKNLLRKAGIDVHMYRPKVDRLAWLLEHNIKTVLDIGANTGQFAEEIRKSLPDAFIYSFEPLGDCFKKLESDRKNDSKFKAFNFAIGDQDSSSTINRSSYSLSSSLLPMADSHKELFPHTKDSVPEKIEVRKLDSIISQISSKSSGDSKNPFQKEILIKVDTQGYEDKVIAGGKETFSKAKVILIEASFVRLYENQPLFDDIYQQLKVLGFSYHGALHQKINPKKGEVIFEDAIFLK